MRWGTLQLLEEFSAAFGSAWPSFPYYILKHSGHYSPHVLRFGGLRTLVYSTLNLHSALPVMTVSVDGLSEYSERQGVRMDLGKGSSSITSTSHREIGFVCFETARSDELIPCAVYGHIPV